VRSSERTTAANARDSQRLLPEPQTASIRFLLTESELSEAKLARRAWINNRYYRIAGRIVCVFGAYFFVAAPSWFGEPWSVLVRKDPLIALETLVFAALDAYVAIGMPGIAALDKLFNRLDLQREVTITPELVKVRRGPKTREREWHEFRCYYETSALYILQTRGVLFVSVPKRAFEQDVKPVFRQILESKLRRKEPTASS
jgi:hypothetical protein